MITLDEAIQNFEELAETQRKLYERIKDVWDIDNQEAVFECAREHEQLAEWLKELKAYRELFGSPEEAKRTLEQLMV